MDANYTEPLPIERSPLLGEIGAFAADFGAGNADPAAEKIIDTDGGVGAVDHPFKISPRKTPGGALRATITPGTLNNIVPKIGSSLLTDSPPPQLSLTANATNYICLSAQFDNSSLAVVPASVKVQAFTSLPANGENNGEFWGHLLLGQVVIGSAAIESVSQFVSTSEQTLRTYGLNNVIWGRV